MREAKMDIEKSATWQFRRRPRRRLIRHVAAFLGLCLVLYQFARFVHGWGRPTHIQYSFKKNSPAALPQLHRLKAVKREFLHAWYGYKDHAWMADALMSVDGGQKNHFCGWSATLVDSLDTLWIMDLRDEFDEAVKAVTTIDFKGSAAQCEVNMFESTIRYLGGMLAAYDLSQDQRLLPKVRELGGLLHGAFNTSNGLPCNHCNFGSTQTSLVAEPKGAVPLADVASLYLEFARLSQITGDQKYMHSIQVITDIFERAQNRSSIPGLWPDMINTTSVDHLDSTLVANGAMYSLGALSDSAYEYLVKAHLMMGRVTKQYSNMWTRARQQIKNYLLFRAYIPQWESTNIMFSGLATRHPGRSEVTFESRTQHLACFAGGMFAMASRIFNNPSDLVIGEGLTNGCVWAYDQSPSGIMPETFSLLSCPEFSLEQCAWNATKWSIETGVPEECIDQECGNMYNNYPTGYTFSVDEHYGLRPEAIESVFVLYRVTGDPRWRDIGWRMFLSIIKHTRTPYGHATLDSALRFYNTTVLDGNQEVSAMKPLQRNEMESFWLAETLKYFWLLFSDTDLINLDEWVLNTEAHPFKLNKRSRGFP